MSFLVGAKLTETLSQGVDEDSYFTSSIQSPRRALNERVMELTGRLEHAETLICWKRGITYSRSFASSASACMVTEPP